MRAGVPAWAWRGALLLAGAAAWPALAAHPFGVPEATGPAPGWAGGFFAQVAAWQTHFYRQLTGAVRAWDQGGAWLLVGLSFAYGVFHALGPGHGKAVISAYVLANRETARNGALLAMLSALVQAAVAIVLVAVAGWLLNVTGAAMNRATAWLETGSYALVALLGAWLVWRKALRPLRPGMRTRRSPPSGVSLADRAGDGLTAGAPRAGRPSTSAPAASLADLSASASADPSADAEAGGYLGRFHRPAGKAGMARQHTYDGPCACGHVHVPPPALAQGRLNLAKAWAAVWAVGLRPCSGAVIVLVFALSQGRFPAGAASALAMGAGTGLTVAALACLALAAGGLARRLAGRRSAWVARQRYAIQAGAALLVLLLGVVLLGGSLAA